MFLRLKCQFPNFMFSTNIATSKPTIMSFEATNVKRKIPKSNLENVNSFFLSFILQASIWNVRKLEHVRCHAEVHYNVRLIRAFKEITYVKKRYTLAPKEDVGCLIMLEKTNIEKTNIINSVHEFWLANNFGCLLLNYGLCILFRNRLASGLRNCDPLENPQLISLTYIWKTIW